MTSSCMPSRQSHSPFLHARSRTSGCASQLCIVSLRYSRDAFILGVAVCETIWIEILPLSVKTDHSSRTRVMAQFPLRRSSMLCISTFCGSQGQSGVKSEGWLKFWRLASQLNGIPRTGYVGEHAKRPKH